MYNNPNPPPPSPRLKSLLHLDLYHYRINTLQDVSNPWTQRLLEDDPRFLSQKFQRWMRELL